MSIRIITCDRQDGLMRAVVWRGKEMHDLYVDSIAQPDMSGAIVRGKVTRVSEGQLNAWIEAGIDQKLYVEKVKDLKSGDQVVVRITTTRDGNKAWSCKMVGTHEVKGELGLVEPPLLPWQRALEALPPSVKAELHFEDPEDYKIFLDMQITEHTAELKKEAVHPDLDDSIESLLSPIVPMKQVGHLIIQQTEALVAIDINGNSKNPTDLNMRAMHEAVRQIRLRNLSGIIMIDCLTMPLRTDRQKIQKVYNKAAEGDRSKALGMTKLGLLEVTRPRRGPSLDTYYDE